MTKFNHGVLGFVAGLSIVSVMPVAAFAAPRGSHIQLAMLQGSVRSGIGYGTSRTEALADARRGAQSECSGGPGYGGVSAYLSADCSVRDVDHRWVCNISFRCRSER